jgi:indole-3-glycerol phosphate synthase
VSTRAPTVLERILAETREEVERRKREAPIEPSSEPATVRTARGGRPFHDALRAPGICLIAEFKRRSPSAGALGEEPDLIEVLAAYRRGGARALSILTEGPNFGGSLEDLRAARAACEEPLLRKDFIVDPYQLHEARSAGADAVLLIVAALQHGQLASLHRDARAIGLDVLVEVHDLQELQRAISVDAEIVGINNRDLRDFSVDIERTERLMDDVPSDVIVVSESGIATPGQLRRLQERGVQAALVGEFLMRSPDPAAALRRLRGFNGPQGTL